MSGDKDALTLRAPFPYSSIEPDRRAWLDLLRRAPHLLQRAAALPPQDAGTVNSRSTSARLRLCRSRRRRRSTLRPRFLRRSFFVDRLLRPPRARASKVGRHDLFRYVVAPRSDRI